MSSSPGNTDTSAASPPRYSTTAPPPPYNASDACSLASKNSTSKSLFSKLLPQKAPKTTARGNSAVQQEVKAEEAKQAARASYFSSLR